MVKNVTVIVPAYNEEETIAHLLQKVLRQTFVYEVIVVDDGSQDQTATIATTMQAEDTRIRVFAQPYNQGKTAAIKTALQHVMGEIVIIQDADLEYDPAEIRYVCEPIWQDQADVVYGSRFLVRKASRVLYFYHFLANKTLTFLSNLLTNKNMTDIETCYKAFRSPLLVNMPITSSGFGFEVEVTANISKTSARIYETPISYYGRTYEEGKKISFTDGLMALWYILRFNIFPSRQVGAYKAQMNEFIQQHHIKASKKDVLQAS